MADGGGGEEEPLFAPIDGSCRIPSLTITACYS